MIPNNQWKQDCFDGITAAFLSKTITIEEAGHYRVSIKEAIIAEQMGADTARRTDGRCPVAPGYLKHQLDKLVNAFEKLKQSRR